MNPYPLLLLLVLVIIQASQAEEVWKRASVGVDGPSFLIPPGVEPVGTRGTEFQFRSPKNWVDDFSIHVEDFSLYNNLSALRSLDYGYADDLRKFGSITWSRKWRNGYVWIQRDGMTKYLRKVVAHPDDPEHHPIRCLHIRFSRGNLRQFDEWLLRIEQSFLPYPDMNKPNKTVDSTATRVTPPASSLRSGQEARHGQP